MGKKMVITVEDLVKFAEGKEVVAIKIKDSHIYVANAEIEYRGEKARVKRVGPWIKVDVPLEDIEVFGATLDEVAPDMLGEWVSFHFPGDRWLTFLGGIDWNGEARWIETESSYGEATLKKHFVITIDEAVKILKDLRFVAR